VIVPDGAPSITLPAAEVIASAILCRYARSARSAPGAAGPRHAGRSKTNKARILSCLLAMLALCPLQVA
jgi:hypothetical protein